MRLALLASVSAATLLAAPAVAGDPQKPVTDRDVNAVDVATTPVTDLNLLHEKIPQLLIDAQANPYDLTGLESCGPLIATVKEFNTMLGDDFDLPQTVRKGPSAGRVAQSVVGSFIPFRGIMREVSGANEQQRKLQAAIQAGIARRSFLKGFGQSHGCRYPARAATAQDVAQIQAERSEAAGAAGKK